MQVIWKLALSAPHSRLSIKFKAVDLHGSDPEAANSLPVALPGSVDRATGVLRARKCLVAGCEG